MARSPRTVHTVGDLRCGNAAKIEGSTILISAAAQPYPRSRRRHISAMGEGGVEAAHVAGGVDWFLGLPVAIP